MGLRLKNSSGNYVELNAPSSIATDFGLTLPVNDGDSGQYLQTDGSGGLSWQTVASLSNAEDGTGTNFKFNSGFGSNGVAYGCRAWVNFNGTGTVAIRASGNVSSITDNGTGDYTVNFTTAMPDANYSITLGNSRTSVSSANIAAYVDPVTLPTTSAMRFQTYNYANTAADASVVTVAIFR